MKIKTVKKMSLPELINYVWENELYPCKYINNFNGEVVFNDTGKFMTDESFISPNSYFTVTAEEELTEDTEFDELYEYYWDKVDGQGLAEAHSKKTIRGIIEEHEEETIPLSIMIRNKIDNHPVLIWTKEHGIPKERIIEL